MREGGAILAYASPTDAAALDSAAGDFSVTFAPPPLGVEIAVNAVGPCLAAAAVGAVAWLGIKLVVMTSLWSAFVPALVALAVGLVVYRRAQCIVRLLRFSGLPVTLALTNGLLHSSDPPQWGLATRVYAVDTIVRCRAEFGGWSIGTRLYSINIVRTELETIEMRVAARNRDVLRRQLADLENALVAARSAKLATPDKPEP